MIQYLTAASTGTVNSAYLITAILAATAVFIGGLAAVVRVIWRTANILRDNTLATQRLTSRFDDMAASVDGRFDKLSTRVESLEQREFGRHDGLYQPGTPGQSERAQRS